MMGENLMVILDLKACETWRNKFLSIGRIGSGFLNASLARSSTLMLPERLVKICKLTRERNVIQSGHKTFEHTRSHTATSWLICTNIGWTHTRHWLSPRGTRTIFTCDWPATECHWSVLCAGNRDVSLLYMYAWVDLSKWIIGDLVMWFHSVLCRPIHVGTGYIVPTLAATTPSSMWSCGPAVWHLPAGFSFGVNILDAGVIFFSRSHA